MTIRIPQSYIPVLLISLLMLSGPAAILANAGIPGTDSDFDGLSDDYEKAIGSDPDNPDTDADGINDADDPTPKGGMLNTEEVWDTWDIEGYIDRPTIMAGETFNVSFNASRLMPDGTIVVPDSLEATLYIYDTRSYYTLMRVEKRQITLRDGSYSFSHRAEEPAKYYFCIGINASQITLGKHATSYEIVRLEREMKLGYVQGAAYPPLYTTVRSIYPTLLPGHGARYFIERYAYAPTNGSHDFLAVFSRRFDPRPVLEHLYEPRAGPVHVHLFRNHLVNRTSISVPAEGRNYNITLNAEGRYNLAVTAYDEDIAWDYSYSKKFPYSNAYVRIINSTVSWVDLNVSGPEVYDNVSIGLHKYSITTTMNESAFWEWYSHGGLRSIATEHPEHATPYRTDVWLSLFYYVQDGWSLRAHTYFDRKLPLQGDAYTSWDLDLPGRYITAAHYSPQKPHHPQGVFTLYVPHGYSLSDHYEDLHHFHCSTDVYLSAFRSSNVYFTDDGVNVSVTGTKGGDAMSGWNVAMYMDGQHRGTVTFDGYDESVNLGHPQKGTHRFLALTIFSATTLNIVESLGLNNFPYNWVGRTTFQVKDFLLYAKAPGSMVLGHPANMSVLVYGPGMVPVENASIKVDMDGYHVSRRTVTTGRTGADGTARLSIEHPGGNYYDLIVTASRGEKSESVSSYAWDRSESRSGYIHTNKPVYLPGDTIHAQFSAMDVDNEVPLGGEVEARLRYNGNGKDIMRFTLELDEYGAASTEFPVSKDAPWGTYDISLYKDGRQLLSRNVGVRYYETPDTRIVFDPDLSLRTGEINIPVKVEYMFGAPVYQGEVSFELKGYENRYEYHYWDWWYGDYDFDCDGIWGGWWYDPAPVFEDTVNVTVENGWANLTLTVPEGLERLAVEAAFSDEFDHSCEGDITYYLGEAPDPDLMTGIEITPEKEPFTAEDSPTFQLHTYAYREREAEDGGLEEEILRDISTELAINVTSYDASGVRQDEALLNLTTDIHGTVELDLVRMSVDTFNLSAEGRYYFKLEVTTASEAVPPATVEHEFFVHSAVFRVGSEPATFSPDTNGTISLTARSLVPTVDRSYNYTLTVFKRERYTGYYYHDYYYVSDGAPVFATSGSAEGTVNVTWKLPEYIDSGRYVVRVTFENGAYSETIDHPVEVVDRAPLSIDLAPSANEYAPGEEIVIDVALSEPFRGRMYLWSSTGCDMLTDSVSIDGDSARFTISTRDWHHDIEVTVFLLDERARMVASSVRIGYGIGPLSVTMEMNRSGYEPGDPARLTSTVLTSQGVPVEGAQLSLSMVDASVFELFDDQSAAPFYDSLVTPWEFEWSYRFAMNWYSDTWYPEELPVETVSYWPDQVPWSYDYDDDMEYDGDADGMSNGAGQGGGMENEAPKDASLDDALQSELDNTDVREWFTDTALWLPSVITDAQGKAVINLTLPDNICKWRIRGTARTRGLIGGEALTCFNVSKDFFIEPKLPYKVTQDDEVEVTVLLYNFNDRKIDTEMGISAGEWLKVFGENQVRIEIPKNTVVEHSYRLKVMGAMTQNLTFIASDFGGNTDAVKKEIFVKPNGALLATHLTGAVEGGAATETFTFCPELLNGTQKAVLRLAAGYEGLLRMGYDMLSGYPYDCTEQITSRMIPAAIYREYLKEKGRLDHHTDWWLTRRIYRELQSLLVKQHPDGGWGWWQGDESSLWMSGWVLLGLDIVKDGGIFVNQQVINDLQDYLMNGVGPDGYWLPGDGDDMKKEDLTAFLYYAMIRSGAVPQQVQMALEQAQMDGSLTSLGLAMYGLATLEGGNPAGAIIDALKLEKKGSHFESEEALGGSVETTGWSLLLFASGGGDTAIIRELLEWLNSRRLSTGDWGTTTATVSTMLGILEVLRGADPVNMDVTVKVNGEVVAREHVDEGNRRDFHNRLDALDITRYMIVGRENNITVEKRGQGELFYELTVIEYLRKAVTVNFPMEISARRGEPFPLSIVADPVNSPNVRVKDLDIRVGTSGSLIYLNSSRTRGADPDSPATFDFIYLAAGEGVFNISPIVVRYKLSAGQRDSGLVTKYYGPVTVNVEGGQPARRSDAARPERSVDIEKKVGGFSLKAGEELTVTLAVKAREGDLKDLVIRDYLSDAFEPSSRSRTDGGCVEFTIDSSDVYREFTYTVVCRDDHTGDAGTAVVMEDGNVLSVASSGTVTVSSRDYFLGRDYSALATEVNSPLDVRLSAWSEESLSYVAVEDPLPPGFEPDETSLKAVVEGSNGNILSYEVSEDRVTFFLRNLERSEIEYRVFPTLPGRLVAEPALMFPMYSPDDTAQSSSHKLDVHPRGTEWRSKFVPPSDDDNITEPDVGEENETGNDTVIDEGPEDIIDEIVVNPPDGPGDGTPPEETDPDTGKDLPPGDGKPPSGEDWEEPGEDAAREAVVAAMAVIILLVFVIGIALLKRRGGKRVDGGPKEPPEVAEQGGGKAENGEPETESEKSKLDEPTDEEDVPEKAEAKGDVTDQVEAEEVAPSADEEGPKTTSD